MSDDSVITPSYDRLDDKPKPTTSTPNPTATPEPDPEPEKVEFSEAQKVKLQEIINAHTGRLMAKVRQAEGERDTAIAASAGDHEAQIATLKSQHAREVSDLKQSHAQKDRDNAILIAASEAGFVRPAEALRLIDTPPLNDDGSFDPAAIKQAVDAYAAKSPHLVKGSVKPGSGSTTYAGAPPQPQYRTESVFGKGSDARLANKIAISNPKLYASMKADAQRKGLI